MNYPGIEEGLKKAAKKLDISPEKYKQAMERFAKMRNYLEKGEYKEVGLPEIYLQGSFKLGTEIRPYKDNKDADYDIDIVCGLGYQKEETNPKTVKHQIGDRLRENDTYKRMLDDEGKRCWTINYAEQDDVGFHMDILPSVQESLEAFTEERYSDTAIAVTNKCDDATYKWSTSNPKGLAEWFHEKNKVAFEDVKVVQKQDIFEEYRMQGYFNNWDEVPNIHVKTSLQRTIQLLKRHRDICFCQNKNEKCKPISIVITVLVAQIYQNESVSQIYQNESIYETLKRFVETFSYSQDSSYGGLIKRTDDGKWNIENPTNRGENFADKWHEEEGGVSHARANAFFEWVKQLKKDFLGVLVQIDDEYYTKLLMLRTNNNPQNSSVTLRTSSHFDVPHRERPRWPIKRQYSVQISGSWKYKPSGSWQKFHSGDTLDKGLSLLFNAKENDVPPPFEVYWQVVNTGKEATEKNGLRGKIFHSETAGVGGLRQKEETLYTGNHWVECFIVKDKVCVARSGEFVVNIR